MPTDRPGAPGNSKIPDRVELRDRFILIAQITGPVWAGSDGLMPVSIMITAG